MASTPGRALAFAGERQSADRARPADDGSALIAEEEPVRREMKDPFPGTQLLEGAFSSRRPGEQPRAVLR